MKSLTENLSGWRHTVPLVSFVLFGAFFLFLWLCIGTELIYYYLEANGKASFFKTGLPFLQECLAYPGGPTQYLAAFFTQLCYFPWIGALCITLVAWGIYRLTASLTVFAADSPWRIIVYLPAILILMICSRYENPLTMSVAVLVVAFFSLLYKSYSPRPGTLRVMLFLILAGILYYTAGSAVLIFIVLSALDELFSRRKPLSAGLYILLGLILCRLLGAFLFKLDENELYLSRFIGIPVVPVKQILEKEKWVRLFEWVLFASIPAVVLLARFRRGQFHIFSEDLRTMVKQKIDKCPQWIIQTVLLFLIAAPAVVLSYDYKAGRTLQVGFYANRRMWSNVLTAAQRGAMRMYYPFCNNAVNRALYHTGRLGDEMFTYPQDHRHSDLVFCKIQQGNVIYMERAELCLELGMVNVAEEIAKEFPAATNRSPYIIKQLAWINLVKRQTETARIYLNALSRYPTYCREAVDLLKRLEEDPLLEHDERVQYLRKIMENNDLTYTNYDEENRLKHLLSENKNNKMAFEYLMAHYLLNRQLDKFVENLPRLDDFGYEDIPRHYQEAMLLYAGTTGKNMGWQVIDSSVLDQYNQMNKIATESSNKDLNFMQRILEPKYGQTYFFYHTFGYSK